MTVKNITKYVFRVLPGILFLFSATAKLLGIDAFELYIFSFGWFSLGTSYLLARLVIAAEYSLGLLLIANFCPRTAFRSSLAMLSGFTLFLAALALAGKQENCNCFGELIKLNPRQSILKNLATLAILMPGAGIKAFNIRRRTLWFILAAVIPLVAVNIISPPDNWRYGSYTRKEAVNEAAFREAVEKGLLPASTVEGEHVLCFYSLKCRFCMMSAKKLLTLRERGEFSRAPVTAIFGRGENTDTAGFEEESGLHFDEIHFIEPSDFIRITNGSFPLILVMKDSVITETFNYRNLH